MKRIEKLEQNLPHGSGIDCDWIIDDMGNYFRCKNSFHCMNENGYYDGYADFTVILPKKNFFDLRLHFNGYTARNKNNQYQLRDYLEYTIYHGIENCI